MIKLPRAVLRQIQPIPDLSWTREVVGQLLSGITAFVGPNGLAAPGRAVKIIATIGKPIPNDAPRRDIEGPRFALSGDQREQTSEKPREETPAI